MFSPTLFILGAALLSTSPVNCVGTAFIENWCNFEVFVWSIADVPNNTINYLAPTNGSFSEIYRTNPNGGGISLKIATIPDDSYITQFEYTYHTYNPNISYDISNVNGYPFEIWGLALSPSTPSAPNCTSIYCDPGVALCPNVYNVPTDDYVMRNCDVSTNLTLTLCPSQTTMGTATATTLATVTTTNTEGSAVLSTLTTAPIPVEPTTMPLSQTTMTTVTETVTATIVPTDAGGNTFLTTLTTVLTPVEMTMVPPSQTTMGTATGTTLATITTTNSEGSTVLSTLTTALNPVEPTTIPLCQATMVTGTETTLPSTLTTAPPVEPTTTPPSQTTMVTVTETDTIPIITTNSKGSNVWSTLTTVITSVETTMIRPRQTTATETTIMTTDTGGSTFPTTSFALAEVVTETVATTDTGGNPCLTTLTTVLAYPR
jgi:hypothetical protein